MTNILENLSSAMGGVEACQKANPLPIAIAAQPQFVELLKQQCSAAEFSRSVFATGVRVYTWAALPCAFKAYYGLPEFLKDFEAFSGPDDRIPPEIVRSVTLAPPLPLMNTAEPATAL